MRYVKNEIDFEQYRCKEIEVFQYKGNFEEGNVPKWVADALNNVEAKEQTKALKI